MAYSNLKAFVDGLESQGELHRIQTNVSPILEISAIADRVSKSPAPNQSKTAPLFDPKHHQLGGKALLFENVQGACMPLLINAYGSYTRLEQAMGTTLPEIAETIAQIAKPEPPVGVMEKLKKGMEFAKLAQAAPKVVKKGDCQAVVKLGDEVNLLELPIIKCWPQDGDPASVGFKLTPEQAGTAKGAGRYITFAGIYTIHPDDADKPAGQPRTSRNVGMYRAQLIDEKRTAMHWHMHHDGARHWRAWQKLGKPMPCAIVLGGESVLPYAATAPMPPGISELLLAGILNGAGDNGGKGIELVQCKTIDMQVPANAEIVIEGYVRTDISNSGDAAVGGVGYDPRNPGHGDIGDGAVYEGPFGDHTGFYSLPDRYPIFEATAMTHQKNPIYPTTIVGRPPQEDYYLGKATERIFLPLLQTLVPDIIDYDLPMFGTFHNCVFVKINKHYPLQARRVMHSIWGAGQMAWTKSIVVVDEEVNVHDHEEVLFYLCANCDPGRDIEVVNGPLDILDHAAPRLGAGHKIGFDATRKWQGEEVGGHAVRDFPPIVSMPKSVEELVASRWAEYGLS